MKKILCYFAVIVCLIMTMLYYSKPTFNKTADKKEVYFNSFSSNASVLYNDDKNFCFNRTGESFKIKNGEVDVENFLSEYGAEIIFTESTSEGTGYYAYTDKIRTCKIVNGEKINLHIFVGKLETTVGTPIIFGSF